MKRVIWYKALASDRSAPHFLRMDQSVLDHVHGASNNRKAVVHPHGGHVSSFADGFPTQFILPTQSVAYRYAPQNRSVTSWYHHWQHAPERRHGACQWHSGA